MGTVTVLWTLAAGVSITLAAVCGAVWLASRRSPASLALCTLGAAVAVAAYLELCLMHSSTVAQHGELLRWYHVPVYVAIVSQLLFAHYYLGTGRAWRLWTVILARSVVLIVDFAVDPNINFSSIIALHKFSLFGEQVTAIGTAVTRTGWQAFAFASLLLMMAYLLDAAVRRWRMGGAESRRKALAIVLGLVATQAGTVVYTQLLAFGFVHGPLTNVPWFVGALLVMAIELGRDFVMDRQALDRLAELQSKQARAERLSVAGQLASTLVHELSQPLAANMLNAATALRKLELEAPNLEELRAILGDINRDSSRGAEVVTRMRQFFKLHTVAMEPLRLEDVVKDVISMVRREARSNHVELSVLMPQDLPRVLGDRVHLSQVLLNLVMNAIHAVQSSPANERRIVVMAMIDGGDVNLSVCDSGPGISEDIAQKLFTPFFTTKPEGMGMGLALSRAIIEAHGGRLWVERMTGPHGADFHFTLRHA
jgi:signal transduction histidine kinase